MAKTYTIQDGTPTDPDEKVIRESESVTNETDMNYKEDKSRYLRLQTRAIRYVTEMNELATKWRTIKADTGVNIVVPANKSIS